MNKDSKIYIAGHTGLVGSAIHRKLIAEGYTNIVVATSRKVDLTNWDETDRFFDIEKPEYVFLAAAKAGGVWAMDNYSADKIYGNLAIQNNVIHSCHVYGVKKLMFIGSNCIYPVLCSRPIKEEYMLSGKLEPTTEHYAIAKIAGIKMCQAYRKQYGSNFISVVPVNLYGENEKYNPETSHVMTALIHKFHKAKQNNLPSVEIWGSGNARREFMHVDDLADACLFLMLNYNDGEPINVGAGYDISIKELAEAIKDIAQYDGQIVFNKEKPDGIISKLLDSSKINQLGWKPKVGSLYFGINDVYHSL